jgi:hypothetical protein
MMPLRSLLKNKILLYKNYHIGDDTIDEWAFWMFEENISIINELTEEENKGRKSEQDEQMKAMGNMNPSSYMKSMSNMGSKFRPKM